MRDSLYIKVLKDLEFKERNDGIAYDALATFGGFPEPFLKQSPRTLRRWQKERLDRLEKEDIRDLHNIRELSLL